MPHRRDPMKTEERRWNGAQVQGERDRHGKDSTESAARNRAVGSTPEGRKSPWTRLADALADPDADPALRAIREAGRHVEAEPGDGVAAFLPGGETLLLLVEADGLLVRRNVTDAEAHLFLAGAREAA